MKLSQMISEIEFKGYTNRNRQLRLPFFRFKQVHLIFLGEKMKAYSVMNKPMMDLTQLYEQCEQWENIMRSLSLWQMTDGEAKVAANELVETFVNETSEIEEVCFKFLYDESLPDWGEKLMEMAEVRNPLLWVYLNGAHWGGRYDINGFVDFLKDLEDCWDRAISKLAESD